MKRYDRNKHCCSRCGRLLDWKGWLTHDDEECMTTQFNELEKEKKYKETKNVN